MIPVPEVTQVDLAFGNTKHLPAMKDIPEEFRRGSTKWNHITSRWFFSGLPKETEFKPKPGVDANKALRAVGAILVSFEPKHEHKDAGVSFLLSEWFEDIKLPEEKK